MKFYIPEIETWEEEINPIYRKAKRLIQVRKDLIKDDWALHWMIDNGGACSRSGMIDNFE